MDTLPTKKAANKAQPKKVSAVQHIQQKLSKTVTATISYAQITDLFGNIRTLQMSNP